MLRGQTAEDLCNIAAVQSLGFWVSGGLASAFRSWLLSIGFYLGGFRSWGFGIGHLGFKFRIRRRAYLELPKTYLFVGSL